MNNQKLRIGVAGSDAGPPTNAHKYLIQMLRGLFDRVIWYPSGDSSHKTSAATPDQKVTMTQLMAERHWLIDGSVTIRYDNVYGQTKSSYKRLQMVKEEFPNAVITWVTGSDSIVCNKQDRTQIETDWDDGDKLIKEPFLIIPRIGYPHPKDVVMPPGFSWTLTGPEEISSSQVRYLISIGDPSWEALVPAAIVEYIKLNRLFGYTNSNVQIIHSDSSGLEEIYND